MSYYFASPCLAVSLLIGMLCQHTSADETRPMGSLVEALNFRDIRGLDRNLAELGEHKAYVLCLQQQSVHWSNVRCRSSLS